MAENENPSVAPQRKRGAPRGPRKKPEEVIASAKAAEIPGAELLTPEEIAAAKAQGVTKVVDEVKANAVKQIAAQAEAAERKARGLVLADKQPKNADLVTFTVDLAEHSPHIRLDSQQFYHGHTYTVPRMTYASLIEIIQRGHEHQREIDGKSENQYRRKKATMLSSNGAVSHAGLVG